MSFNSGSVPNMSDDVTSLLTEQKLDRTLTAKCWYDLSDIPSDPFSTSTSYQEHKFSV